MEYYLEAIGIRCDSERDDNRVGRHDAHAHSDARRLLFHTINNMYRILTESQRLASVDGMK